MVESFWGLTNIQTQLALPKEIDFSKFEEDDAAFNGIPKKEGISSWLKRVYQFFGEEIINLGVKKYFLNYS